MARWGESLPLAELIPDQSGRVALVTGANSGIGFETALQLARRGAHVLMACRNRERGERALARIQASCSSANVELLPLDLADLEQVSAAVAAVVSRFQRLDLLICNAGVMVPPEGRTAQGHELQFGVNHLGHFALSLGLLPLLLATSQARVVVVSSGAAAFGRMVFNDLNFERRTYQPWAAYGQSKLANLLFVRGLHQSLQQRSRSLVVAAAHPGVCATELQRYSPGLQRLPAWLAMPAAQGALPTLRAATDLKVQSLDYFGPDGMLQMRGYPRLQAMPPAARRQADVDELWRCSLDLCGLKESQLFETVV